MDRRSLIDSVVNARPGTIPVRDPRLPTFGRLWLDPNRLHRTHGMQRSMRSNGGYESEPPLLSPEDGWD